MWGSVVFGWRALRPPRVVFVLGCVSLINALTFPAKYVPSKTLCSLSKPLPGRSRLLQS